MEQRKHSKQPRELIPMKLSHTEMSLIIKNKMRNFGMSYEQAEQVAIEEYRFVFKSEISRVNRVRAERKNVEKQFKQNFKELVLLQ